MGLFCSYMTKNHIPYFSEKEKEWENRLVLLFKCFNPLRILFFTPQSVMMDCTDFVG